MSQPFSICLLIGSDVKLFVLRCTSTWRQPGLIEVSLTFSKNPGRTEIEEGQVNKQIDKQIHSRVYRVVPATKYLLLSQKVFLIIKFLILRKNNKSYALMLI